MQIMQTPPRIDGDAMSGNHLGHLLALAHLHTPLSPLRVLEHTRSITAEAKQHCLPPGVWVQKSVTLLFGKKHLLLVSSLGNFRLGKPHYQALARILRLSMKEAKCRQINPGGISARITAGLP